MDCHPHDLSSVFMIVGVADTVHLGCSPSAEKHVRIGLCHWTALEGIWLGTSLGLPQQCVHNGWRCRHTLASFVLQHYHHLVQAFDLRGMFVESRLRNSKKKFGSIGRCKFRERL